MPLGRTRKLKEDSWLVHRNVQEKNIWWPKETQRNHQIYSQVAAESKTGNGETEIMGRTLLPHHFLILQFSRREIIKVAHVYRVFTKGWALHILHVMISFTWDDDIYEIALTAGGRRWNGVRKSAWPRWKWDLSPSPFALKPMFLNARLIPLKFYSRLNATCLENLLMADSGSVGLLWGLRFCIYSKFPGDAEACGPRVVL